MRLNDAAGIRLKFLGVLFLFFSVASVAWLYYFKEGEIRRIVLTGMVDATQVAISSKIQGRIERLYVDEGSEVKAGENIARIDFEELKSDLARWEAEVREAEARMKEAEVRINEAQETLGTQERVVPQDILRARAMLRVSEANKDEAQANLERARKDHGRISQLVDQGILAIQESDRVEAELVAAQAAYHSAIGRVEEGKAQLEMALANSQQLEVYRSRVRMSRAAWESTRAALKSAQAAMKSSLIRYEDSIIRSPLTGLVSARIAREGEIVKVGAPIVTVVDIEQAWVRVDVEESYIDRISLGQELEVALPSGRKFLGKVYYKGVESAFATARDVNRTKRDIKTFALKLAIDNRTRVFYPGMTVEVAVLLRNGA